MSFYLSQMQTQTAYFTGGKATISISKSGSITRVVKITARNRIVKQGNLKGTEKRTFHKMCFYTHSETIN